MNIFCKVLGHRMYFKQPDITSPTYCKRWKCDHEGDGIKWPKPPPMPDVKPPKIYISETALMRH